MITVPDCGEFFLDPMVNLSSRRTSGLARFRTRHPVPATIPTRIRIFSQIGFERRLYDHVGRLCPHAFPVDDLARPAWTTFGNGRFMQPPGGGHRLRRA